MLVLILCLSGGCSTKSIDLHHSRPSGMKKIEQVINSTPNQAIQSVFLDVTSKILPENAKAVHLYAVDYNGDGRTDLVALPEFYATPVFYQKEGDRFVLDEKVNFNETPRASYLTFVDLNRDGLLDLFAGTLNQKSAYPSAPLKLFLAEWKEGSIYYRQSASLPEGMDELPNSGLSLIDFDLDGHLDLFIPNWISSHSQRPVADWFLKGEGEKFFKAHGQLYNEHKRDAATDAESYATPSFSSATCDLDNNGLLDILVSSTSHRPNKAWLNRFSFSKQTFLFENFGEQSKIDQDDLGRFQVDSGGNTHSIICGDYNNDGIWDLLLGEISHGHEREEVDRSSVLTGSTFSFPPQFIRNEYIWPGEHASWSQGDRRHLWIDFNNDGLQDFLVVNSGFPPESRLILFEQQSDHEFIDRSKEYGVNLVNPSGTVSIDFNGDGKMDIISGQSDLRAPGMARKLYAFANVDANSNRSIRLYLRGKKANFQGIGAVVRVKSKKWSQMHFHELSYGALPSQNEEGLHYGLPQGEHLQWIEVTWPYSESGQGKIIPTGMKKKYVVKDLASSRSQEFTLCDDGRWFKGRRQTCF